MLRSTAPAQHGLLAQGMLERASLGARALPFAFESVIPFGLRIGVVDLIRTGRGDSYVLEVDTDGYHMLIDRQFKSIPDYRDFFDLDRYIAEALLVEPTAGC